MPHTDFALQNLMALFSGIPKVGVTPILSVLVSLSGAWGCGLVLNARRRRENPP